MRRWGLVVTTLYALILVVLLFPAGVWLAGEGFGDGLAALFSSESIAEFTWLGWLFIGLFVLAQAALFFVSVDLSRSRPKSRRHIAIPVATTAFAVGCMSVAIVLCTMAAMAGDDVFDIGWFWLIIPLAAWSFWGFIFFLYRARVSARLDRVVGWLIGGSILQLLVAVPTHIWVRHRDDCCAPTITGFGISTGIALMLMALGPSVLFLYRKRLDEYRPEPVTESLTRWPIGVVAAAILAAAAGVYLFTPVESAPSATGTVELPSAQAYARIDQATRVAADLGMTMGNGSSLFGGTNRYQWRISCAGRVVAGFSIMPEPGTQNVRLNYELFSGEFAREADYARFTEALLALNDSTGAADTFDSPARSWLERLKLRTRAGAVFGAGCRLPE